MTVSSTGGHGQPTDLPSADFYFDVISPYAYLFFELIEREPLPLRLVRKPVVFAALLDASGNKGPAEIPAKRLFTYRFCTWQADRLGVPLVTPAAHPFNPIRYLRLCLAGHCSTAAIGSAFRTLWTSGLDPASDEAWALACRDAGVTDADARVVLQTVKDELRANTDEAIRRGVFGVPTILLDDWQFWGVDSLPMLRDYLAGKPIFESAAMQGAATARVGASR